MSVKFSGTITRSGGLIDAINKNLRQINLKAVSRITISFDPFKENVRHTRDFLFFLSSPKVTATNPNCAVKTNIICNRAPSTISFSLIPAVQETSQLKQIKIDADNLTSLELLQICNKYVTKLAPKEEIVNVIKTKSEKKAGAKKR
ncbi:uncharacterized protein LOC119086006 [Bradysia coprophila]|uniref:uncharacterized protein LOC119086006 n=1 Tax=Bradysia coprophila TaxID=38358 RepID=UPI00187DA98C|nr:uncharacterized protein LOC119086006 [Bradysia coprophila]